MTTPTNKPPCSTWGLWYGLEIEGQDENALGKKTLFVRRDDPRHPWQFYAKKGEVSRVWFCKEWNRFDAVVWAANLGEYQVALEVGLGTYHYVPAAVYDHPRIQIFFKVGIKLKAGDHVCVGHAFSDEAFMVGKKLGNEVNPAQYHNDICILP